MSDPRRQERMYRIPLSSKLTALAYSDSPCVLTYHTYLPSLFQLSPSTQLPFSSTLLSRHPKPCKQDGEAASNPTSPATCGRHRSPGDGSHLRMARRHTPHSPIHPFHPLPRRRKRCRRPRPVNKPFRGCRRGIHARQERCRREIGRGRGRS